VCLACCTLPTAAMHCLVLLTEQRFVYSNNFNRSLHTTNTDRYASCLAKALVAAIHNIAKVPASLKAAGCLQWFCGLQCGSLNCGLTRTEPVFPPKGDSPPSTAVGGTGTIGLKQTVLSTAVSTLCALVRTARTSLSLNGATSTPPTASREHR
jgi:hypothetical protein